MIQNVTLYKSNRHTIQSRTSHYTIQNVTRHVRQPNWKSSQTTHFISCNPTLTSLPVPWFLQLSKHIKYYGITCYLLIITILFHIKHQALSWSITFKQSTTGIFHKAGLHSSTVNIITPKTLSYSETLMSISVSINFLTMHTIQLSSE